LIWTGTETDQIGFYSDSQSDSDDKIYQVVRNELFKFPQAYPKMRSP
jgi:hypothetical protein